MLKGQLLKQADSSLTTGFSGPKSSRHFRETGPWTQMVDGDGAEPMRISLLTKSSPLLFFPRPRGETLK